MITEVILPKLGLTMEEGTILTWLKQEGDEVVQGEPLVEMDTDKATMELEAPASGILRRILIPEGEVVPVTTLVALIADTADEPLPEVVAAPGPTREAAGEGAVPVAMPAPRPAAEAEAAVAEGRQRASPAARKLAQELGIDLAQVRGSGPGGRITSHDVERAAAEKVGAAAPAGEKERVIGLSRMRRAIAASMTLSATTIPQFAISREVDMTAVGELRQRLLPQVEKEKGVRLSYTDIIVRAVAQALPAHPLVNASFEAGETLEASQIRLHESINIGLAVALEEGLIVPVIPDADRKSLAELAVAREQLEAAAQRGRLSASQLGGATFTISNLGGLGVDQFQALVNPPQVAILAVGRIAERVVPTARGIETRPMLSLTLTADHRVLDGASAAAFLATVAEHLERPEE
ncbi:MAG: dihydrolipoamide acetyltransferase family protein [Dehalococcoidia bacterium]